MPIDDTCYEIPRYGNLHVSAISHRDAHVARKQAQSCAEKAGGVIATLPELLCWRMESDDDILRDGWCLLDSDEYYVHNPADGKHVLLVVHGGGLFSNPNLVRKIEHAFWDGGVELDKGDSYLLQIGINHALPSFPTYSYDVFLRQAKLPRRYGVRIEQERIANLANGFLPLRKFEDHPLFIARCGGKDIAHSYLDCLAQRDCDHLLFGFFDGHTKSPMGTMLQSAGDASITTFFGDLPTMAEPHYLVAREKRFSQEGVTYRDAPKRI